MNSLGRYTRVKNLNPSNTVPYDPISGPMKSHRENPTSKKIDL
jgi:hypothetical protein